MILSSSKAKKGDDGVSIFFYPYIVRTDKPFLKTFKKYVMCWWFFHEILWKTK